MNSLLPETEMTRETAVQLYSHACELNTPSNRLRPRLSIDGNQWCALPGENLQEGVAGFGSTPAAAYADFDRAWATPLPNWCRCEDPGPHSKPGAGGKFCAVCGKDIQPNGSAVSPGGAEEQA